MVMFTEKFFCVYASSRQPYPPLGLTGWWKLGIVWKLPGIVLVDIITRSVLAHPVVSKFLALKVDCIIYMVRRRAVSSCVLLATRSIVNGFAYFKVLWIC